MDAIDRLLFEHPEIGALELRPPLRRQRRLLFVAAPAGHQLRPTGRHWNFNLDIFIVDWLEHLGVDYDVITEEDLHYEGLDLLRPYGVVLTGSHPEYIGRDAGRARRLSAPAAG